MSILTVRPPTGETGVQPYRLTTRQYLKMIDAGVFPEGARVELLGGVLVEQMTKHPPHDFAVDLLADVIGRMVAPDWIVRQEKSISLGRYWRPEPDLAIVRGPRPRYRGRAPTASDLALIIDVDNSSYAQDRGIKWRRYAEARVPIYWIAHLSRKRVEVHRDPAGRGASARFRGVEVYEKGADVPVVVDGREVGRIAVNDFVP